MNMLYNSADKKLSTIEELKSFLMDFFKDEDIKIFLFGSRAKGNFTAISDIDLGFLSDYDIDYKLSCLREILENSNIVQKVDIVNLKNAPHLQKTVQSEGVRWI